MDNWLPWKCEHGENEPFKDCPKCLFLCRNRAEDEWLSRALEEIKKSLPKKSVEESLDAVKGLIRRMEATPGYMDYQIFHAYADACILRNDLMAKQRAAALAAAKPLLQTAKTLEERLSDFHAAAEGYLPIVQKDACYGFYQHFRRVMAASDFPDLLEWYTHDKGIIIPDDPAFWSRLEAARAVVIAQAVTAGMELSTDPNDWTSGVLPTPYEQAKGWLRCREAIVANAYDWL